MFRRRHMDSSECCHYVPSYRFKQTNYLALILNTYNVVTRMITHCLLSPRNALRWGYSNAAVVPSVRPCVRVCVVPSVRGPCEHDRDYTVACWFRPSVDLVNTIETTPLRVSLSNLADLL